MPLPSRPFLLDLPRELRQHILSYVFEDAIEQDIHLNNFLRNDLRKDMRLSKITSVLSQQLTRVRWLEFDSKKIYAPHIHDTAAILMSIQPEIADDLPFVSRLALDVFQKIQEEVMEREFLPDGDKGRAKHMVDLISLLREVMVTLRQTGINPLVRGIRLVELMGDYGIV